MADRQAQPKLPNMNEFSPSVVGELGPLLTLTRRHQGDRIALKRAIADASHFESKPNDQHLNRANNVLIGMSQCGLFDLESKKLTELGELLANEPDDAVRNSKFATQLLVNCHGADVIDAVRSLIAKRETITGDKIRDELKARGFTITTNEGNPSKIRLWLERSGVIDPAWKIDEDRYKTLMGIGADTRDEWNTLSRGQKAFLLSLRQVTFGKAAKWVNGSHVKELCLAQWGPKILPEGDLRAKVINPLIAGKWIEARGKGEGRGGKLGEIQALAKLLEIEFALEIEQSQVGVPRDLSKKLDTPLETIYSDLESADTYKKGIALELLCLRLCFGLGLRAMGFRKRGEATKGAEVDLIADGVHLHYSRWMFQCKNTPRTAVDLEDLAKEVGLAVLLRAHVIVMVTTGRFAKTVKHYADGVATETHLQVILIDGVQLKRIRDEGEGCLIDILKGQAREALTLKSPQVLEILHESDI
jgi:hypothetical protein